jgi:hypothetical protein
MRSALALEMPSNDNPGGGAKPWATSWALTYSKVEELVSEHVEANEGSPESEKELLAPQWTDFLGVAMSLMPPRAEFV